MKNNSLKLTLISAIALTCLTSFGQQDKKAEKARKNLAEANMDLKLAKVDSTEDYQAFRKDIETKIADNQKKIDELRKEKASDNKKTNEDFMKKVNTLEVKNNTLKKKIAGSDKTETSRWASFKREFKHDMDELGTAFKDLVVDNKK